MDGKPLTDWTVYLIRCGDGSLYTGITTDIGRRLTEHRSVATGSKPTGTAGAVGAVGAVGKGAKALRGKGPLTLVFSTSVPDRSTASSMEYRIKHLSRRQKQELIQGLIPVADLIGK